MKYCIIILLLLVGCNTNRKRHNSEALNSKINMQDIFLKPYGAKKDSIIQQLIVQIENSECVYMGGEGIEGRENPTFNCYKELLEIAPDSLWTKLSSSQSAVMRFYAYITLLTTKPKSFEAIRERLKKDTAHICWNSNDIYSNGSIGYFVSILAR